MENIKDTFEFIHIILKTITSRSQNTSDSELSQYHEGVLVAHRYYKYGNTFDHHVSTLILLNDQIEYVDILGGDVYYTLAKVNN